MPRVEAARELLAPREDVWAFLAAPHHLPDWWPGLAAVQPDRRGFAPGARWEVHGTNRPSLFRRPSPSGMLLVLAIEPLERWAFQLTGERLEVEIRLSVAAPDRTVAVMSVTGPWLIGLGKSLPRSALARLHALCQTAASL